GDPLAATEGWNFLSNPWPAAYDLEGHPGVPFYQYRNGQYETFLPGTTVISNNNNLVPPMGGFWLQNVNNSLSSFTFNRNQRTSAIGTTLKRGGGNATAPGEYYIRVQAFISNSQIKEETVIIFDTKGNDAYIYGEDAIKRKNDYGIPNMYTMASGYDLAIQSLPLLDENRRIPLYFDASGADAVVEIGLDHSYIKDGLRVFLEDKQLNTMELISENNYSFVVNEFSQSDRFVLHFTFDQSVTVESFNDISSYNAWVYRDEIHLRNPNEQTLKLQIYDVAGRALFTEVTANSEQLIPVPSSLSSGVYLLRISDGSRQMRTIKFVKP
ncbi:MAG: T9SS C-terminal target domain-containing protein, partial [Flavobacteriales bacterium]